MWQIQSQKCNIEIKIKVFTLHIPDISGLWITDGRSYIFTLTLRDFSTLPSAEKHHTPCSAEQQQQKWCYKPQLSLIASTLSVKGKDYIF